MKPTPARTLTRGRRPLGVAVTFFLLLVTVLAAPPVSHAADTTVNPARNSGAAAVASYEDGTVTDGADTEAIGSPTVAPSTTYPTTYSDWQNGLLAGNGKQGVIVFGNPRNDTVVFDDKDFFMARTEARPHRTFNTVSQDNINKIRDELIAGQYQQANQLAADVQGYQGGGEGSKHPGYKMALQMPDAGTVSNYVRSTDYAAGVLKVNWSDDKGSWERDSFVSRTDGATVQYQAAPPGQKETVTLGLSIDPGMNLLNKGVTYTTNNTTDYLNLRAKYPNGSYNAGYEGVTRIVTDGTKTQQRPGHRLQRQLRPAPFTDPALQRRLQRRRPLRAGVEQEPAPAEARRTEHQLPDAAQPARRQAQRDLQPGLLRPRRHPGGPRQVHRAVARRAEVLLDARSRSLRADVLRRPLPPARLKQRDGRTRPARQLDR
ncbi:glycoside hydrolase N-terminal domain-containing protein [Streptomyces sp. NPDC052207]|uniref:glycoside hydrolase N-terminal domain-containing protein n=1 Tax=Streptomyces sp. NPDC052207 TaxID=3155418 RepID=UPI00343B676A